MSSAPWVPEFTKDEIKAALVGKDRSRVPADTGRHGPSHAQVHRPQGFAYFEKNWG